MNCPKCRLLLFVDKNSRKKEREYHCMGCSSYGTINDMKMQKIVSDIIFEDTLSKVKCKICEKYISVSEAKIAKFNFLNSYVCRNHKEEEYDTRK